MTEAVGVLAAQSTPVRLPVLDLVSAPHLIADRILDPGEVLHDDIAAKATP